jgi:hypothetical protein
MCYETTNTGAYKHNTKYPNLLFSHQRHSLLPLLGSLGRVCVLMVDIQDFPSTITKTRDLALPELHTTFHH